MISTIKVRNTVSRLLQGFCIVTIACSCFAVQAFAGDISVEIGRSAGVQPKGGFVDGLGAIDRSFPYHAARFSLKYAFDWGLVLGREQFGSHFRIDDGSDESHLFVRVNSLTLGWVFGQSYRVIVEVGIPENGEVATSNNSMDFFNSDTLVSQKVGALWAGLTVDFGLTKGDAGGLGATFNLRLTSMSTDDLFESGNSFDASGLYLGGGLRYRF